MFYTGLIFFVIIGCGCGGFEPISWTLMKNIHRQESSMWWRWGEIWPKNMETMLADVRCSDRRWLLIAPGCCSLNWGLLNSTQCHVRRLSLVIIIIVFRYSNFIKNILFGGISRHLKALRITVTVQKWTLPERRLVMIMKKMIIKEWCRDKPVVCLCYDWWLAVARLVWPGLVTSPPSIPAPVSAQL